MSYVSVWRATARALVELGIAAFFIAGVAWSSLGASAPWFVLAAVALAAAFRAADVEARALFVPGGLYGSVRETLGGLAAKVAASALLVDRLVLGPLAAMVAGHYVAALAQMLFGRRVTDAGLSRETLPTARRGRPPRRRVVAPAAGTLRAGPGRLPRDWLRRRLPGDRCRVGRRDRGARHASAGPAAVAIGRAVDSRGGAAGGRFRARVARAGERRHARTRRARPRAAQDSKSAANGAARGRVRSARHGPARVPLRRAGARRRRERLGHRAAGGDRAAPGRAVLAARRALRGRRRRGGGVPERHGPVGGVGRARRAGAARRRRRAARRVPQACIPGSARRSM